MMNDYLKRQLSNKMYHLLKQRNDHSNSSCPFHFSSYQSKQPLKDISIHIMNITIICPYRIIIIYLVGPYLVA